MFAGLAMEGSDDSDGSEVEAAPPTRAQPPPPKAAASLLPEADEVRARTGAPSARARAPC